MTDIRDFRSLEEYRQWLRMYRLFRDYPIEVIRAKGREHLPRIAGNVGGAYFAGLVADWGRALDDPDPGRMVSIALDTTQYGVDMRQINPFQGIMSHDDLMKVIRDSRNEQKAVSSSSPRVLVDHRG